MSQTTTPNSQPKQVLDDNARKCITEPLDPHFLDEHSTTSYILTVDWLETGEDNEKKLAYKKFDSGDVQILLIAKVTKDGSRTSVKEKITEEKYKELLGSSILHLEKKRYEFEYPQNDIVFSIKYDEFAGGKLCLLEVDAQNEEQRTAFDPDSFSSKLTEVTGNLDYYGYRVANVL